MPILLLVLRFVDIQILQALITAQMVKDATLAVLKCIAQSTKSKFDDKIYKRVKFYFTEDKSEHIKLDDENK